jgi:hypothetical protein
MVYYWAKHTQRLPLAVSCNISGSALSSAKWHSAPPTQPQPEPASAAAPGAAPGAEAAAAAAAATVATVLGWQQPSSTIWGLAAQSV